MGYWGAAWENIKNVGKKVADFGEKVCDCASKAYSAIKEEWNSSVEKVTIKTDDWLRGGGHTVVGGSNIDELTKRQDSVTDFQDAICEKASKKELAVKKAYGKIYAELLEELSEYIDTDDALNYVKEKKKSFKNIITNEVNANFTLSNERVDKILSNMNLSRTECSEKLQDYADKVYKNAERTLLDELDTAVKDTNKYIKGFVNNYLDSQVEMTRDLKVSLEKLNKDDESKTKEVFGVAKTYSALSLIEAEAGVN